MKDECNFGLSPIEGFDCSGFVTYLLASIRFPLSRTIRHCSEYFDSFGVLVHQQRATIGDLIFFSRYGDRPTHMGILISPDEYIHAPGVNGTAVRIESYKVEPILNTRNNQLYYQNPIGFKRLATGSGRWKNILT